MTSSLKQVKNFSDPKMIYRSATIVDNSLWFDMVIIRREKSMTSSVRQIKFYNDQTDDFICF